MTDPLNETERGWLVDMFDRLGELLGRAGCNDFDVTINAENRATLAEVVQRLDDDESAEHYADVLAKKQHGDRFTIYDFLILAHLRDRLGVDS